MSVIARRNIDIYGWSPFKKWSTSTSPPEKSASMKSQMRLQSSILLKMRWQLPQVFMMWQLLKKTLLNLSLLISCKPQYLLSSQFTVVEPRCNRSYYTIGVVFSIYQTTLDGQKAAQSENSFKKSFPRFSNIEKTTIKMWDETPTSNPPVVRDSVVVTRTDSAR